MYRILLLSLFLAATVWAQVTSGRLQGVVTDPNGAVVPGSRVTVTNVETGAAFSVNTTDRGTWAVPSLPTATYKVTVTASGFKATVVNEVKLDAGVPATVNVTLELGTLAETIEVSGGAEVLQTATSAVSSTLTGRQINEMPFTSQRNALDLLIALPGTQTPGTPRTSSINGLPKGSLNVTLDGINIQDNLLKSSDGFFAVIEPKSDSVEEVTLSTAGSGAESSGEGAAQVKFVTRSGTNQWHGGALWQVRNDYFDSNYYFNTVQNLKRDRVDLNQVGARLGGPIWKNKAFFFVSDEEFRLPQTYRSLTETVLTPDAMNGVFTYKDTQTGQLRQVNLYNLAAAKNPTLPGNVRPYATTADPTIASILQQINSAINSGNGTITGRVATNGDYNRSSFNFQSPGKNDRRFETTRLDFNLTPKHHLEFVENFNYYNSNPDGVNNILPIFPGSGTVLGHPESGGIWRENSSLVAAVRSTLTSHLTSEVRFGVAAFGNSLFRGEIVPGLFSQWRGYAPTFGATSATAYAQSPFNTSTQSRRNTPVRTGNANLTWSKGSHLWNYGGSWTQVNSWQSSQGTQLVPTAFFAIATGDPVHTGATDIFNATTLPNSTPTNQSDAAGLYALLTGRVSSFSRSLSVDENTHKYGNNPQIDRNRQREFALYFQDAWRARPNLTVNYGLRWDVQFPFLNLNGTYSRVGLDGVYGLSGVGNLFKPGTETGVVPQFLPVNGDTQAYKTFWKDLSPSLGFAYVLPKTGILPLEWITGRGEAVFRGGYSISTIREGMNVPISIWGSNQGPTASASISPSTFPADFGPPGSVLFRDPTLPVISTPAAPAYPIAVNPGNSVNDFDPNLKQAYVQSWTASFQREMGRDTVIDIRYVGNHGTRLWRQINLNEVNIFENGFLTEFKSAANNLAIARAAQAPGAVPTNDFGNHGLPGQVNIPVLSTALGTTIDQTTATQLVQGQAGATANAIASNATRMNNLMKAGYPANFFIANPTVLNGGAFLVTNGGSSTYNALQVELRRRMVKGVQVQGSYTWGKALSDMDASSSSVFSQPSTLRNPGLDKGPSPWDIRHAFKFNWIYGLPFGPGRRFLSSFQNPIVRKALEGWEIAGVARIQSGSPAYLRSGRQTFNAASGQSNSADAGVVLHNLTASQLQSMVSIRKDPSGTVYYLPQSLLNNTYAAFEINGKSLADLDPSAPYIGPPTTPGVLGERIYLYGPWQQLWNLSAVKKTKIGEKKDIELRAQFLNAFNAANFLLGGAGNDVNTLNVGTTASPAFGQTLSAYRDFNVSGTNDPGGRVIEFALRFNF